MDLSPEIRRNNVSIDICIGDHRSRTGKGHVKQIKANILQIGIWLIQVGTAKTTADLLQRNTAARSGEIRGRQIRICTSGQSCRKVDGRKPDRGFQFFGIR